MLKATAAAMPWMVGLNAPRVVSAAATADPPDIVLVVLDALRAASLPMYGHPRDTAPFLAILARHSTVFKQCSSTVLWTRPAVTGMLTGLWPIEHGQWSMGWEALAPIGETLEASVQYRSTSAQRTHVGRLSYLLGQGIRPNHTWRVGECVVDVLHLRLPAGRERIAVDLTLRPGWRYQDDEDRPTMLMARHPSGSARPRALIASAAIAELPQANRDLLQAKRRDPIHYRLYDVAADPSETRDLLDEEPEVFESMHATLLPLLEREWSAIGEGPEAEVPAATRERLRAMGYVE